MAKTRVPAHRRLKPEPTVATPYFQAVATPYFHVGRELGGGVFICTDVSGVPYRLDADHGTWKPLKKG